MYSFDEFGNVLIDKSQQDLVAAATRARTLSRRASALTQNQFIPFQPVTGSTWAVYQQRLATMFTSIFHGMKVPGRGNVAAPRGGNDFRTIYFKALNDWASVDLQGFHGPIPATEVNGLSDVIFFLPADGAVIRYLGRLLRKYPGFFTVMLGPGNGYCTQISTLDSSAVRVKETRHCMAIRVREHFGSPVGSRLDASVGTLKAILRTMEISTMIGGLNQIITTLSRKMKSLDGTWGEDPKFPIVNFNEKVRIHDWLDLSTYAQNFHGNNKELYGDRAVYSVIELNDKLPFLQPAGSSSGEHKWTQPRA